MHASLTAKNNIRLMVLWAAVGVAVTLFSPSPVWPLLALGAMLGAIGGSFQLRAIRGSRQALLGAENALQVRSALRSTRVGAVYIYFLWLSMLVLLAGSICLAPAALFFALAAGYASFAFVREWITLSGVLALQKSAASQS